MREKARFRARGDGQAHGGARLRLGGVTATQVYTVFDIHPLLADEIVPPRRQPGRFDLAFRAPPVQGSISRWMYAGRIRIRDLTLRLRLRVGALQKQPRARERRERAQAHGAVETAAGHPILALRQTDQARTDFAAIAVKTMTRSQGGISSNGNASSRD